LKAVLKLGSVLFDSELSGNKISSYAKVIKEFSKRNRLVVVTGGGSNARKYIAAARELGASEFVCDQIGIHVSRLNARLLAAALGESAFPKMPESPDDLMESMASELIVVMGGLQPGQSTNAVTALAAEAIRADLLVNATKVDGAYTADPRKDPKARKLDEVTPDELMEILSMEGFKAGEYDLMDPLALRIIKRSKVPVVIVDGRDPSNIEKALSGKRVGTKIVPAERRSR
jgi:uridylate kinase